MHYFQPCLTSTSLIYMPKLGNTPLHLTSEINELEVVHMLNQNWPLAYLQTTEENKNIFSFVVKFVFLVCFGLAAVGH